MWFIKAKSYFHVIYHMSDAVVKELQQIKNTTVCGWRQVLTVQFFQVFCVRNVVEIKQEEGKHNHEWKSSQRSNTSDSQLMTSPSSLLVKDLRSSQMNEKDHAVRMHGFDLNYEDFRKMFEVCSQRASIHKMWLSLRRDCYPRPLHYWTDKSIS